MKHRLWLVLVLLSFSPGASAQTERPAVAKTSEPQIVERGPHHALHHWTTEQLWPAGRTIVQNHYVTEIARGLNFFKAGEWLPSREEIEIVNDVAIAGQGQFQVIFGSELNAAGAIDLSTEDGKRFQSRILGLVYLDSASGATVLIAETQNSQGQVLPPNRVFYLNAFEGDGIQADVRYPYRKGSFEQDILFRTRPHPPSA